MNTGRVDFIRCMHRILLAAYILFTQASVMAQSVIPADNTKPLEGWKQRFQWAAVTSASPERLTGSAISAAMRTGLDQPPEYGPHWDGFGKRTGVRIATGALSTFMETGVGGFWNEDPRYYRAGSNGKFKTRIGRVVAMSVMARSESGQLTPAYGRWIAIPAANAVSNVWRPESERTASRTATRASFGFAAQIVSNAFSEFWPDIKRHVFRAGR